MVEEGGCERGVGEVGWIREGEKVFCKENDINNLA